MLNISPRTLQTLRDNGTLAYSQINRKVYYKPEDVERILYCVADRDKGFLDSDFSFQFLKWMGVCGAEKSAPDKKEINIYILIKLYNIYII